MKRPKQSSHRAAHDESYKQIFAYPEMMEALLRGFVAQPWVDELDLASLERVNNSYVAEDFRGREDDLVWRVRPRAWNGDEDQWLYIYLLLEFQSTVDRYMAVRTAAYEVLLYQDIIRTGGVSGSGKLPPAEPIVLYNGSSPWNAPTDIADLISAIGSRSASQGAYLPSEQTGLASLISFRPSMKYLLLEENRFREEELAGKENPVAAMFRLENARTPRDFQRVLRSLKEWLPGKVTQELLRTLIRWIRRVVIPSRNWGRGSGEVEMRDQASSVIAEWEELETMLAERVREWERIGEIKKEEGLREGLERGRQEGEATILLRLLERRFAPLPEAIRQRVLNADTETLQEWSEHLLDAARLEDVLRYGVDVKR